MPPAAPAGASAPPAAPGAAGDQQQQQQPSPIFGLLRMLAVWWLIRAFMGGGGGGNAPKTTAQMARSDYLLPLMQRGTPVDLAMVLSEKSFLRPGWSEFYDLGSSAAPRREDAAQVVWKKSGVPLATMAGEAKVTVPYTPSEAVKNNGTLYLHVVVGHAGAPLDASIEGYDASRVFNRTFSAVAFRPLPKKKEGVSLLSSTSSSDEGSAEERGEKKTSVKEDTSVDETPKKEEEDDEGDVPPFGGGWGSSATGGGASGSASDDKKKKTKGKEDSPPREIVSFLKPNLTVAMIDDFQAYARGKIPDQVASLLAVDDETHTYDPTLWLNDFWLMRSHLVQLNDTVAGPLDLHLSLYSLPSWKLLLYTQMEASFAMQQSWGAMNDGEPDELKRVLTEGNPYFLALTMAVSMLHSVFDALAFKNDIGFWKGKQDVAGLSVRTIGFNAVCQLVIFLYLLDNDTSFVVLASTAVGVAIEFWKLTQAMHVTVERRGEGEGGSLSSLLPFRLKFNNKASYTDSKTDEHDAVAMWYLGVALVPCVAGYALYTLKYETHRSWYSWVLSSLVGAVYAFGFALMCPQLYLNYKLKSVAHLPWRQMTYKFLNTIIDDLFAFVIKMPTLHRVAVFRDDVVFAVYLYQRWIYRVDATRANEFGFVATEAEAAAAEGEAGGSGAALPAAGETKATASAAAAVAPSSSGIRQRRAGDKAEDEDDAGGDDGKDASTAGGKKDE